MSKMIIKNVKYSGLSKDNKIKIRVKIRFEGKSSYRK